jgi:hypothetical protein
MGRTARLLVSTLTRVILFGPIQTSGQYAMVKRVSAETAEGIVFGVWVEHQTAAFRQPITIHFEVENRSARRIYLVREDSPYVVAERGTISIGAPIPSPIGHGGYDYSFHKIERGKPYQGQLVIAGDKYNEARSWLIQVEFGYVNNIDGLDRKLAPNEDPAILRGRLYSRLVTVVLGGLRIEAVEK